jgi:hypothetical protein
MLSRASQGPAGVRAIFATANSHRRRVRAAPTGAGMPTQGLAGALTSLLSFSSSSGSAPSDTAISSLPELRQAIAGLANYDGLYASFPGHAKRPVYRDRSLLITGRATLRFVA